MKKKVDRRITKTKTSIRNAFIDLIGKKNIDQITITELAERSNIDRKTFYLHYNTVIDVYKELISEISLELQELLNENTNFSFSSFFQGLNYIMEKDKNFYKTIAQKDSYSFLINECVELLKIKLSEKYKTETAPLSTEMNIKIEYASSGIIGVYVNWLRNSHEVSLDELTNALSYETELLFKPQNN